MPLHASEDTENKAVQESEAACSTLLNPPQWQDGELIFYNQSSRSILIGITISACAFFLFAIIVLKRYRRSFLTLDRKGIILGNGKRLWWKELEQVYEKNIKRTSFSSDLAKAYDLSEKQKRLAEEMMHENSVLTNKAKGKNDGKVQEAWPAGDIYLTENIMDVAGTSVINPYQDYFLELTFHNSKPTEESSVRTVKLNKGLGGMSSYKAIKDLMDLIRAYQEAYERVQEGEEWDVEYAKSKLKNSFSGLEMQTLMLRNATTKILALFVAVIGFIEVILCWGLYCQYKKSWEKICTMGNISMTDCRDGIQYAWDDVLAWEQSRTYLHSPQGFKSKISSEEHGLYVREASNNRQYKFLLFPEKIIPPSIWKKEVIDAIKEGTFFKTK